MTGPAGADTFSAAPALTLETGGTVTCAATDMTTKTQETGEPTHGSGPTQTAWWTFTPTETNLYRFDTSLSPTGADTVLSVYTGIAVGALTEVGYTDDDPAVGSTSKLDVMLNFGTTYRIQVTPYSDGDADSVVLRASLVPTGYVFIDGADTDTEEPAWNATVIPYLSDSSDSTFLHFSSSGGTNHDYLELYGDPRAIPSTPITAITMTIRGRSSGSGIWIVPYLYSPFPFNLTSGYINYYGPAPGNGMPLPVGTTFGEVTVTFDEAALAAAFGTGFSDWQANDGTDNWTTVDEFVNELRAHGFQMHFYYSGGTGTWDISSFNVVFETAAVGNIDVLMENTSFTLDDGAGGAPGPGFLALMEAPRATAATITYPFISGNDPEQVDDAAAEATIIPTLSDGSDSTYLHFDYSGTPDFLSLVLVGDMSVIPADSSTVTAITFTIRARTISVDGDGPWPVSMFYFIGDLTFPYHRMRYENYTEAYDPSGDFMSLIIPPGTDWAEATVTLDDAGIADAIAPDGGFVWSSEGQTWTTLAEFVDALRDLGEFGIYLTHNYTGVWDLAAADLTFQTTTGAIDVLMENTSFALSGGTP